LEINVLGPLRVTRHGEPLVLRGVRPAMVLATLALSPGRVVLLPDLIDAVWGEGPPSSAIANIRTYVHGLRRLLGSAGADEHALRSHPAGYQLELAAEELDLLRFREHAGRGNSAMERADLATAVSEFDAALDLWLGKPLEDLVLGQRLAAKAYALTEESSAARSARIDAHLALGHYDLLIPQLLAMVAEDRLRERTWSQLLRALSGAGRTGEALAAFRSARAAFVKELGVEPGGELQRTHQALLANERPAAGSAASAPVASGPVAPVIVARAAGPAASVPAAPAPAAPRIVARVAEPGHARPQSAPATEAAPSLPAAPAPLVGREATLQRVRRFAEGAAGSGAREPTVVAISGSHGVGKTALALAAAHDLRGVFPDVQLFAHLDGFSAFPRSPADVLADLLRELGVSSRAMPEDMEHRGELFRRLTVNKRLLLILDDAVGSRWLRPLLPVGHGGRSLVLVTGRNLHPVAGVHRRIDLRPLEPEQSVELLTDIIGTTRSAAEPRESLRIAETCDHLPLALRIAGERLSAQPELSLKQSADILADESRRLDYLNFGGMSIRKRLSGTYHVLDTRTREAFCRLGCSRASVITQETVSGLIGVPETLAEQITEQLTRHHLLLPERPSSSGRRRYRMPFTARAFAKERQRGVADRFRAA
jgi:DNA-binding SARP family transcriptional activator